MQLAGEGVFLVSETSGRVRCFWCLEISGEGSFFSWRKTRNSGRGFLLEAGKSRGGGLFGVKNGNSGGEGLFKAWKFQERRVLFTCGNSGEGGSFRNGLGLKYPRFVFFPPAINV